MRPVLKVLSLAFALSVAAVLVFTAGAQTKSKKRPAPDAGVADAGAGAKAGAKKAAEEALGSPEYLPASKAGPMFVPREAEPKPSPQQQAAPQGQKK